MDWLEFTQYPCPLCGSIEYRDFGGGFHCREGHRNAELLELVGDDDDDFLRSKMSMRGTQLSAATRLTQTTSKVATRKRKLRSGRGDHDINARYGITPEFQGQLFEEERARFRRSGDLSGFVDLESMEQVVIAQITVLTRDKTMGLTGGAEHVQRIEWLARKLMGAYGSALPVKYSHVDRDHPELQTEIEESIDELDKELHLSDHDYSAEDTLSDTSEEDDDSIRIEEKAFVVEGTTTNTTTDTNAATTTTATDSIDDTPSSQFKYTRTARPFANPLSCNNATLITYLALLLGGVPVLLDDFSERMERAFLPGYHPDFILSKDLVTTRVTSRGLRRYYTRHLPSAAELYSNVELMLRVLSRQCLVDEWTIDASGLLKRVMKALCIPLSLEELFARFVLPKCNPLRFRVIGQGEEGKVFAGPCAQVAAGVVFVCRLMLWEDDSLLCAWKTRLSQLRKRFNDPEHSNQPLTDPDEFEELLRAANAHCYNRLLPESAAAVENIFGVELLKEAMIWGHRRNINDYKAEEVPVASITELNPKFEAYLKYPAEVNLAATQERYQLVLEIVERSVGVRGYDLHRIICNLYE